MCASTRFPEVIPLSNIKAKTITKALTILYFLMSSEIFPELLETQGDMY
jgi:hypothetical protein